MTFTDVNDATVRPAVAGEPAEPPASSRASTSFLAFTMAPDGTGRAPVDGWPTGARRSSSHTGWRR